MFNITNLELSIIPLLISDRYCFTILFYESKIFIIGGCNALGIGLNDIIDINNNNNHLMLKCKRFFHSSLSYKHYIIVIGGYGDDGSENTIEIIDVNNSDKNKILRVNFMLEMPVAYMVEDVLWINFIHRRRQCTLKICYLQNFIDNNENPEFFLDYREDGEMIYVFNSEIHYNKIEEKTYTWINTESKVSNGELYFFKYQVRALISFDITTKHIKEIDIDYN